MTRPVSDIAFTPAVKAIQDRLGSRSSYSGMEQRGGWSSKITPELAKFIAARDSFYLGTANSDGQPYIQHRGGPKGFLKVIDESSLVDRALIPSNDAISAAANANYAIESESGPNDPLALLWFALGNTEAIPSGTTGILAFSSFAPGSGECYVMCHGHDHAPASYGGFVGTVDALASDPLRSPFAPQPFPGKPDRPRPSREIPKR